MKICKKCNIEKLKTEFKENRNTCVICRNEYRKTLKIRQGDGLRDYVLKKTYNITLDDFKNMTLKQNNLCDICGLENLSGPWNKKLVVDHDHTTGKVRSLLCDKCNRGLGQFNDDLELLLKAHEYLKKFKD